MHCASPRVYHAPPPHPHPHPHLLIHCVLKAITKCEYAEPELCIQIVRSMTCLERWKGGWGERVKGRKGKKGYSKEKAERRKGREKRIEERRNEEERMGKEGWGEN
jgi:hypothetical protein